MAQEYISGTVSKILWHFTGGPSWDAKNNRQYKELKKLDHSFEILKKIIESKQLKLSNYHEIVKVKVPIYSRDLFSKKKIFERNKETLIKASRICCLADIPIQHLNYHSKRYGKFAIGFHRNSAIRNNFNPVFYTLNNSPVIQSINSGLLKANELNFDEIEDCYDHLIEDVESGKIFDTEFEYDADLDSELQSSKTDFEIARMELDDVVYDIKNGLNDFVSFIKSFDVDEFNSIYCEREWRSLTPFNFKTKDIAMIVLPKRGGYYNKLIREKLLSDVPIVPWEDLIES